MLEVSTITQQSRRGGRIGPDGELIFEPPPEDTQRTTTIQWTENLQGRVGHEGELILDVDANEIDSFGKGTFIFIIILFLIAGYSLYSTRVPDFLHILLYLIIGATMTYMITK